MRDIEGIEEGSLEPALAVSTVAPFSAAANASAPGTQGIAQIEEIN